MYGALDRGASGGYLENVFRYAAKTLFGVTIEGGKKNRTEEKLKTSFFFFVISIVFVFHGINNIYYALVMLC